MTHVGAVVRVDAGTKRRTGVVLRLFERNGVPFAYVLWGTGTPCPGRPQVQVHPRQAAGTALELDKLTFFYPRNVWAGPVDNLETRRANCPPEVLNALRNLVGIR